MSALDEIRGRRWWQRWRSYTGAHRAAKGQQSTRQWMTAHTQELPRIKSLEEVFLAAAAADEHFALAVTR